ncbi:MAG: transcriptional regulator [Planctomycetes bacterium]|nr:transcriptional regulator [Planctomycetota bacterium]
MKPSRISRVVRLLTTLQAGKNYSVDDLAKMFGTSRRTIFRDLNELEAIGVPYRYDLKTKGYSIDPEFFLPPINLNLREALSLLLLVYKTSNQVLLPFKNSALLAALKIENNLPAKIKKYCNTALKTISTKPSPQAPMSKLDKTFASLQKAIVNKKKIKLVYHSLFENKIVEPVICPYHLMYNHRAWYVLGFSHIHKAVRTFKLNRIKNIELLDKCFLDGDKFDVDDYLGQAWSMIPEGRIYNIKLKFTPKVAHNVGEVNWHSTQKTDYKNDGSAIMEFRVDGLNEIIWWILGYGDQVLVLAPKALRTRIVETAQNTIKVHKNL